ncbi:MAG: hypothetical protein OSA01_10490, partial [Arenicellales bacterium]|nr:hypothetical protein [Arenicellales bacterium]
RRPGVLSQILQWTDIASIRVDQSDSQHNQSVQQYLSQTLLLLSSAQVVNRRFPKIFISGSTPNPGASDACM